MVSDEPDMELASGIAAFEAKEFRRAWQLLDPLCDNGVAEAQYRCAIMLQNGLGVIARPKVAAELMEAAARQDYGLAQHSLGCMYLFGKGWSRIPRQRLNGLNLPPIAGWLVHGQRWAWCMLRGRVSRKMSTRPVYTTRKQGLILKSFLAAPLRSFCSSIAAKTARLEEVLQIQGARLYNLV